MCGWGEGLEEKLNFGKLYSFVNPSFLLHHLVQRKGNNWANFFWWELLLDTENCTFNSK